MKEHDARKHSRLALLMSLFMTWTFLSVSFHHHEDGDSDASCSICVMMTQGNSFVVDNLPSLQPVVFPLHHYPALYEKIFITFRSYNTFSHAPPCIN